MDTPARAPAAGKKKQAAKAATAPRSTRARTITGNQGSYYVLIPTVALLLMGLVMVFSAGSAYGLNEGEGYRYFLHQLIWAGLGTLLLLIFSRFDYHRLGRLSWPAVLAAVALLVVVLAVGTEAGGSRRWLSMGPVNIQPTEFAKFAVVIVAAYAMANKGERVRRLVHLLVPVMLVAAIAMSLMLGQPDLGSALVLFFAVLLVLGVSRARPSHVALIGTAGAAIAVAAMFAAPYRRARWLSFLNPWNSPRGYGYQVIQSYVALGSGSIKGVGLGMSRQKFLYLPNAHTDFIFAIIGEELGIFGTLTVVVLVGMLAFGGMKIARSAPDELGKLLAAGITGVIVIQALVNMGGVTGLLPITGVPLPLVSFGGSSLCVCMASIGILLNIASQGKN